MRLIKVLAFGACQMLFKSSLSQEKLLPFAFFMLLLCFFILFNVLDIALDQQSCVVCIMLDSSAKFFHLSF